MSVELFKRFASEGVRWGAEHSTVGEARSVGCESLANQLLEQTHIKANEFDYESRLQDIRMGSAAGDHLYLENLKDQ